MGGALTLPSRPHDAGGRRRRRPAGSSLGGNELPAGSQTVSKPSRFVRAAAQRGHETNPVRLVFGNMDYNGGPVMPSNTDYLVFWSPEGSGAYGPGVPPEYISGIEQYFKDLAHDSGGHQNVDSVSTQYNDSDRARSRNTP